MGKTREQGNQSSATNLYVDITNNRVGIGTTIPISALHVVGVVTATSYQGDGSQLTGIISISKGRVYFSVNS